jgi:hypothetical protein
MWTGFVIFSQPSGELWDTRTRDVVNPESIDFTSIVPLRVVQ